MSGSTSPVMAARRDRYPTTWANRGYGALLLRSRTRPSYQPSGSGSSGDQKRMARAKPSTGGGAPAVTTQPGG
jgi:hypothetical protein